MKRLLCVLGLLACALCAFAQLPNTTPVTPAPLPNNTNYCQSFGSGGTVYNFNLLENFLAQDGKTRLNEIRFYHYQLGTLRGVLYPEQSVYDREGKKAYLKGAGNFNRYPAVAIQADVTPTGGLYGQGTVVLRVYDDRNRNHAADPGEPLILNLPNGLPARATSLHFAVLRLRDSGRHKAASP